VPKPAALTHTVRASRPGRIGEIDGWCIAGIARRAGAPFDKGAGIDLLRGVGDDVTAGEGLFTIHASAGPDLEAAVAMAAQDDGFVLG